MIHVLIERHIGETLEANYEEAARNVLYHAYKAPGFMSGETYSDAQHPTTRYVFCRFRSLEDWQRWLDSPERYEAMSQLNAVLDRPEIIRILTQ